MILFKTKYVLLLACFVFLLVPKGYCKKRANKALLKFQRVKDLPLSKDELAGLTQKTTYKGKELSIKLVREVLRTSKVQEEGNSPFRLCLSALYNEGNRRRPFYQEGEGEIFLINKKNEIAAQNKLPLRKLCPS